MNAETMFREYRNLKRELCVLEFQLKQFQGIQEDDLIEAMSLSRPESTDRVQTSSVSDKTAKVAMNYRQMAERENDEWFQFLWNRCRLICEELSFFEHSVFGLSGILPDVVMDLVCGDLSWDEMMSKYNVSHAMIGKYKKMAIKQLDMGYELRDRQTEAFILS